MKFWTKMWPNSYLIFVTHKVDSVWCTHYMFKSVKKRLREGSEHSGFMGYGNFFHMIYLFMGEINLHKYP